ncbi:MAG: hypothetical protein WA092_03105 [Minisyncoccales bacterium]
MVISPREKILKFVKESTDDGIRGEMYKREEYLQEIRFGDIIDIILLYISLQSDIETIGRINTIDFQSLLKKEWFCWTKNNKDFQLLNSAWASGPGPLGGTAGPAEMYMFYFPGITNHEKLWYFFSYPIRFGHSWENYRDKHIKIYVFPKWRRHPEKIEAVLDLAEIVCKEIRKL